MNAPQLPPEAAAELARQIAEILRREAVLGRSGIAQDNKSANGKGDRLPPFATAAEVGALVNFTPRTLRRKVLEGLFPAPIRVGKRAIRWNASDIYKWLDELEAAK